MVVTKRIIFIPTTISYNNDFNVFLVLISQDVVSNQCLETSGHFYDNLTKITRTFKEVMVRCFINVREYQRGNHKWTIQRNLQHSVHETKTNKAKVPHNTCWTSLCADKRK